MKRTSWRTSAAAAFIVSASAITVGGTMPEAQAATEPPYCATEAQMASGNGNCTTDITSESSSEDSVKGHVRSVNGIKFRGVTKTHVLAWVHSTGMPHSEVVHAQVYVLPKAMTLWTSYINVAGQEVWHWKYYAAGHKFYRGSDGWYHDKPCDNKVKVPISHKTVPANKKLYGHYKVVKVFKFSGFAKASLAETAVAGADAWANGYLYDANGNLVYQNGQPVRTCHSDAHAKGRAHFAATAVARIKGRIFMSVEAAVQAMVQGANSKLDAQLGGQTHAQVIGKVWADARGQAEAEASATAQCTDTHQTTPENRPPTGEIVQYPAHLYTGGEYRVKVVGSDPEDNGNVTLSVSVSGPIEVVIDAQHPVTEDIEGTNKVRYFWIRAKNTPGTAAITLVVTDSAHATFTSSKSFPVLADEF